MAASEPIVIVGGGRAAVSLVDAYRDAGGEAPVTILSDDAHPPYNRPPLSKFIVRGEMPPEDAIVHPLAEYEGQHVELRLGTPVASVDPESHTVTLGSGETVAYGTLVIASGSSPRTLPVPGADLPNVHTLRTLDDAIAVNAAATATRRALVVGGSFIGSEVAASLQLMGLEVTIVELGDRLTPALGSTELSQGIGDLYREHGVEVLLGEQVAEFVGDGQTLVGARTASGLEIDAGVAVVGVGVRPSTGFLEGSGIELDNGVVVDEHFRASAADVYAIGDVARYRDTVVGRHRRIEHWSAADGHGKHLGQALAGTSTAYAEVATFFTKLFDLQLQVLGDPDGGVDEVALRGSVAARNVLGLYLRDDCLVGAVVVGQEADTVDELKGLLRRQPKLRDRIGLTDAAVRPAALF